MLWMDCCVLPCKYLNLFFYLPHVLQLLWNRGEWVWTTSFRGLPQTPTPASSEYHLTHVIVLLSVKDKASKTRAEIPVVCPPVSVDSHTNHRQSGYLMLCYLVKWVLRVFSFFLFFYFSPEVQSILTLSPPQEAELMNANPSPPVSMFTSKSDLCAADICISLRLGIFHPFWPWF